MGVLVGVHVEEQLVRVLEGVDEVLHGRGCVWVAVWSADLWFVDDAERKLDVGLELALGVVGGEIFGANVEREVRESGCK